MAFHNNRNYPKSKQVLSKQCQILMKPSKYCQIIYKICPNGQISPNLVTLVLPRLFNQNSQNYFFKSQFWKWSDTATFAQKVSQQQAVPFRTSIINFLLHKTTYSNSAHICQPIYSFYSREQTFSGQPYKASMIVNYDSRVIPVAKLINILRS